MTRMSASNICGNFVIVIIAFGLILGIGTSAGDDAVGRTDAGDVKANVSVENGKLSDKITRTDKTPSVIGGTQLKTSGESHNQNLKNGTKTLKHLEEEKKNESQSILDPTGIPLAHMPSLNPGALKRAFYVFVGLSVVVVAYLMFRSSRIGKSPAQMVRKYGVLAHKQDIEMRPLPLDEDDEDDTTVFDVSGLSPQRQKHQAT